MVQFFSITTRAATFSAYTEIFHREGGFSGNFVDLAPIHDVLLRPDAGRYRVISNPELGGNQEAVRDGSWESEVVQRR